MKAIFFDHDGTLIDSEITHFELWKAMLADMGKALTFDYYHTRMAGISVMNNASDIIRDFSLALTPQELFKKRRALTLQFLQRQAFPLMHGAKEALFFCKSHNLRVAIVTGGARLAVEKTVSFYGFGDIVECIVSSDDVVKGKPSPDCYLAALSQMQLASHEVMAVEDTEFGLQAAVSAGIKTVAIPTPLSVNHDFSKAAGVYENLESWVATLPQYS
ncbi:HAD family phosphatase [Alteromonas sp. ALT199]|uniref:HAD family hydrolase n=1 Tax=unclassified Alteromonas TaxID=2614992 RepID=UPI001BE556BE|nr:HAD family phosphatase [Alteromonas sp. ALT199]MBT3135597.1 HAD family phosphatase [Alteromonas sp. ALT199]